MSLSKTNIALLFVAIALILLAMIFEVSFATGVSGACLIAGLVYAYIVARREVELLSFASENRFADQDN